MLKKLVKYGNSNALVLDKALLELLNMSEGSVVKIKTDGTSLIITPQKSEVAQTIMPTINPQEAIGQAALQNVAQYYENPEEYMSELKKITDRYANVMSYFESQEYKQAILAIDKRFDGNRLDADYGKEISNLHKQYQPELMQMDQEIQALAKKYAPKGSEKSQKSESSFSSNVEKFKYVHEKYRHVQEQVMKLNENPEYINESVMLAEKYQVTKNSREYIQEYNQLIAKYIPEYAHYQDEIKAIGESIK